MLALRYFYVAHEWERNVEMQARARVHALQARIRPHFLFNSMNTIASLTRTDPALAESAVQDLADLFRANLSEKRNTITLAEELEVAQIYQRIEQLRLGDRLRVDWNISQLPDAGAGAGIAAAAAARERHLSRRGAAAGWWRRHGRRASCRERARHRGRAQSGEPSARTIARATSSRSANIRERLSLMYGERALVKAGRFDDEYIVTLRFPHVENRAKLPA